LEHRKSCRFVLSLSGSIWEHLDGSVWLFRVAELFRCAFQTILHFANEVYHYQQLKIYSQLDWVCVFECIQKYTSECTWEHAMKYTWQLAFNFVASSMIDYVCRLLYGMSNISGLHGSGPGWNEVWNSGICYELTRNRTTQQAHNGILVQTETLRYSALYKLDCGSIVQFLQPSWQFCIPVLTVWWHNLYMRYPLWLVLATGSNCQVSSGSGSLWNRTVATHLTTQNTWTAGNGPVLPPKTWHFKFTILAPIKYLGSDRITTRSIRRLYSFSHSFTCNIQISDLRSIHLVANETPPISLTICHYFTTTPQISVGVQIWM
jgi:hypothetical protein